MMDRFYFSLLAFCLVLATPFSGSAAEKDAAGLYAIFETSMGNIKVVLYEKEAPKTVANFVGLAEGTKEWKDPATGKMVKKPLYNGTIFHRVIPQFMIQGGDPAGNGTGGPGFNFEDEFNMKLRHDQPGRLSMANRGPNTNGSQFFITEVPTPWLDGKHTIFGQVVEGQELVSRITAVEKNRMNKPIKDIILKRVVIKKIK